MSCPARRLLCSRDLETGGRGAGSAGPTRPPAPWTPRPLPFSGSHRKGPAPPREAALPEARQGKTPSACVSSTQWTWKPFSLRRGRGDRVAVTARG